MEIGVYYGGRLDRLEEITKNLERETEVTWGNGDDPSDLGDFNAKAFSYLLYDNKSTRCLTVGDYCDNEVSAADFVAKVKEEQPKSNIRWIEGHFYSGTFDDGVDTFRGVCFCSNREDGGGLVLLSSSAPDDTATRTFYYPESLESTENIKDITEEVSRLWK
jgi:hypothetical protein